MQKMAEALDNAGGILYTDFVGNGFPTFLRHAKAYMAVNDIFQKAIFLYFFVFVSKILFYLLPDSRHVIIYGNDFYNRGTCNLHRNPLKCTLTVTVFEPVCKYSAERLYDIVQKGEQPYKDDSF